MPLRQNVSAKYFSRFRNESLTLQRRVAFMAHSHKRLLGITLWKAAAL